MQKPTRALIVDDDKEICALLCSYLADFGIEARGVHDGVAMRRAIAEQAPDVIILDLMLPGEDGLTLCRYLRANGNIPVIMLTARGEPADRVVGLELGADDYVVKPFSSAEVIARVRAVLRRTQRAEGAPAPAWATRSSTSAARSSTCSPSWCATPGASSRART